MNINKTPNKFFELIENKDWTSFRQRLSSQPGYFEAKQTDHSGITALSSIVLFRPPVDVVEQLVQIHPEALFTPDACGSYSLHLACEHGASRDVVDILLSHGLEVATRVDEDERVPLHHAVEYLCREEREGNDPSIDVVMKLCLVAPDVIMQKDKFGDTSVEILLRNIGRSRKLLILHRVMLRCFSCYSDKKLMETKLSSEALSFSEVVSIREGKTNDRPRLHKRKSLPQLTNVASIRPSMGEKAHSAGNDIGKAPLKETQSLEEKSILNLNAAA